MRQIIVHDCNGKSNNCTVYNCNDFPITSLLRHAEYVHGRDGRVYYNLACAYDIECTSVNEGDTHYAYMYQWQFCIEDSVCFGRTWEEYETLVKRINRACGTIKLPVYVHNLAYEFQFLRSLFHFDSVFARKERVPLKAVCGNIEYRCSWFLTNKSLALLTSSTPGCRFWKRDGDAYDYDKYRTPETALTEYEEEYCYCDVRGLCECIRYYMRNDDMASIPMTSTGFVRRDCRAHVLSNSKNQSLVRRIALTPETYQLCKEAFRGGDTSANGIWADIVLEGIESYDMQSSYPAVMIGEKFPMTKFKRLSLEGMTRERYAHYMNKYACLAKIVLYNVEVKDVRTIPYLDKAHCRHIKDGKYFNGRVLSAERLEITLTDIDWKIIEHEYKYSNIRILSLDYARYGYLPDELREYIMELYRGKCELKKIVESPNHTPEDEDLYIKYKNLINACFGMMVTDICNPDILYDGAGDAWSRETCTVEESLKKYYRSHKTFLTYQWGVWVTAWGRYRLRKALHIIGRDSIYSDTDSVKCHPGYSEVFEELSAENISKLIDSGIDCDVVVDGHHYWLGEWEHEKKHGGISRFRTCGAKKYCTEYNDGTLEITVAGCNKRKGSRYLKEHGGIEAFKPFSLSIPPAYSGRMTARYVDEPRHYITLDGRDYLTGSSIAMEPASYTLGLTGEYIAHLRELRYDYYVVN